MIKHPQIMGLLAFFTGAALLLPVVVEVLREEPLTPLDWCVATVSVLLLFTGLAAAVWFVTRQPGTPRPPAIRAAVFAAMVFIPCFALEVSDGLVRHDGALHRLSAAMLLPTLVLLDGLLAARRWAWWTSRGLSAVFALWFFGFIALIPFGDIRTAGVPVPWYGRVYMVAVSLALGGILLYAFRSLGRNEARAYFGLLSTPGRDPA
jgi:hypothetical protein